MAEHMGGHILELHFSANAIEDADYADEMPIAPVGRKDEEGIRPCQLGFNAVHRNFSQRPDLCAALGVGKANAAFAPTEPLSF